MAAFWLGQSCIALAAGIAAGVGVLGAIAMNCVNRFYFPKHSVTVQLAAVQVSIGRLSIVAAVGE